MKSMCWSRAGSSLPARDYSCHSFNGPLKNTLQEMSGQPFPTPSLLTVDTAPGMDLRILRLELVFISPYLRVIYFRCAVWMSAVSRFFIRRYSIMRAAVARHDVLAIRMGISRRFSSHPITRGRRTRYCSTCCNVSSTSFGRYHSPIDSTYQAPAQRSPAAFAQPLRTTIDEDLNSRKHQPRCKSTSQ
jgi:hypothetical protein